MKIDSRIFDVEPRNKKEAKQIFLAKCGLASEFAEMSFDRTKEGQKNTDKGIAYANKRIKELGYRRAKRFKVGEEGKEVNADTPNAQILCFHNDTQIVIVARGTCNKDGWAQNFKFKKVMRACTEIFY